MYDSEYVLPYHSLLEVPFVVLSRIDSMIALLSGRATLPPSGIVGEVPQGDKPKGILGGNGVVLWFCLSFQNLSSNNERFWIDYEDSSFDASWVWLAPTGGTPITSDDATSSKTRLHEVAGYGWTIESSQKSAARESGNQVFCTLARE